MTTNAERIERLRARHEKWEADYSSEGGKDLAALLAEYDDQRRKIDAALALVDGNDWTGLNMIHALTTTPEPESCPLYGDKPWLPEKPARHCDDPQGPKCNCGWGGEHDPDNPRCQKNTTPEKPEGEKHEGD
jgi:hypothetical protein